MKTIMAVSVLGAALTLSSLAHAANSGFVTDRVLVDLAQGGNTVGSHGIWTGR